MNVVIQLFLYDLQKCSTSYERQRKENRIQEFASVLCFNLANPYVKSVHVLCESQSAADYYQYVTNEYSTKAVFTVVGHQPTYKEIMEYVKKTFVEKEIVCVMNADIFFNSENDYLLIEKHLQPHHLFSLTRHEFTDTGHKTHTAESCPFTVGGGSSDTFIFYTPLRENLDISKMDFRQNLFGAEGVFMKPWSDAGYEIWNPCDDIITVHLHQGRIHFETYATINNDSNSVINLKTPLPQPLA